MKEREQATKIANMWLEFQMNPLTQMVPGDPDCDACVLARQYLRSLDRLRSVEFTIVSVMGGTIEGMPTQTINYLQRLRQLVRAESLLFDIVNLCDGSDALDECIRLARDYQREATEIG